jgi:hypothetical protein
MAMIKFTNAASGHTGDSIYLNSDWIVAIFEAPSQDGGSLKTLVYGGPVGTTWEVAEGLADAMKLLKSAK